MSPLPGRSPISPRRNVTGRGAPRLGTREQRLIANCSRLELGEAAASEAEELLEGPLDWQAILFHARLHSVASLLHHHVARVGSVPREARLRLLRLYHRTAYQNRILARENAQLLTTFAEAGVPVLVQKGISLVERVYGSLALRPLIDLVFLVPEAAVARAKEALLDSGYRPQRMLPVEAAYRWCCPQFWVVAEREMRVAVLLQWNLMNWPRLHRFDAAPLWERARPAEITGRAANVLSPTDQLLYLCLQADNHGYFNRVAVPDHDPADLVFSDWTNNRLIRFTDIAEVIRHHRREIDWEALVDRARQASVEASVFSSLSVTQALLEPGAEAAAVEALRTGGRERLRRWIYRGLADGPPDREAARPALTRVIRRVWLRLSPKMQGHAGRLIGHVEYCFPSAAQLRLLYRFRSRAWIPLLYAGHATHAVLRSAAGFARKWFGRRIARTGVRGRRARNRILAGTLVRRRARGAGVGA